MYKYKNISDFRQSLVVKGKRVLLKPDDVIESDAELKYIFLEKVDESTPVSVTSATSVTKTVDELQQRLSGLEKEKTELAAAQTQEVYDTVAELATAVKSLEAKFADLAGVAGLIKDRIDVVATQVQSGANTVEANNKIYIKKLEMLKSAVMTIEEEVFGPAENTKVK